MSAQMKPSLRRHHVRGFTIVELMITIVISSVLIAAIYQLFAKTSEAMYEVDSLSEVTNRGRFAVEKLTQDIETSGAYASASLDVDPWRNQPHMDAGQYTARGLMIRPGLHQDVRFDVQTTSNRGNGLLTSSDELIVLGALDYPFGFEVSDLQPSFPSQVTSMLVPADSRGLGRLFTRDPFDVVPIDLTAGSNAAQVNRLIGPTGNVMSKRVLRIRDRNGFVQMAPLLDSVAPGVNGLQLNLDSNSDVPALAGFMYRRGGLREGLEPSTNNEDDTGYEVSLIDAYRYRLCQDPTDATNLKLVRERIDAGLLLNLALPTAPSPALCGEMDTALQAGVPNNDASFYQVTLADNVVDFQVWVDCADLNGVELENNEWNTNWIPPTPADTGHTCLSQSEGRSAALARVLHVRFSVRTENERKDLENFGFYTIDGASTTTSPTLAGGTLQTFDIDGEQSTAARLKTFQTDIQLKNFSVLNPATR